MSIRAVGRRSAVAFVCLVLLATYLAALFLDLPVPAGTQFRQNLTNGQLADWGVKLPQSGVQAPDWWDKTQGLRGWSIFPEGWSWPKISPVPLKRLLVLLTLGILGGFALWWFERRTAGKGRIVTALGLLFLIGFAYLMEEGGLWLKARDPEQLLGERVVDRDFTGYYTSALQITDVSAFFSEYDRTIKSAAYCSHCRTHPPGPVLFYWLLLRGVEGLPPQWQTAIASVLPTIPNFQFTSSLLADDITAFIGGNLILLFAAAIVLPLYALARQIAGARLALSLAALGAVLPGLTLMSPEYDQFYGLLAAVLLLIGIRGLNGRGSLGWWGFGTGLFLSFCLFWSLGLGVLVIPLVALPLGSILGAFPDRSLSTGGTILRLPARGAIRWLLAFAIGVSIPWSILWHLGGLSPSGILAAAREDHLGGITLVRPYLPWLVFNLVDFLQFVGLPLVLVTLLAIIVPRSRTAADSTGQAAFEPQHMLEKILAPLHRRSYDINIYSLLFWGLVLALDLSGTTRAEVGRLWIFLMPLALLAVYQAVGRGLLNRFHVYALLGAQFIVCLAIGGNWFTP